MTLLQATQIGKSFEGRPVLEELSLRVHQGEVVCILGQSGAGKTTLLRCLNLLEYIDQGFIEFGGHRVIEAVEPGKGRPGRAGGRHRLCVNPNQYRRSFGVVPDTRCLFPGRTVLENVVEGAVVVRREQRDAALRFARELLATLEISEHESAYPDELSLSRYKRVALARALAVRPDILLIDELTNGLYPSQIARMHELLAAVRTLHGTTMVVVTHHVEFAKEIADRIYFLDGGRIAEKGSPKRIAEPQTEAFRSFLDSVRAAG